MQPLCHVFGPLPSRRLGKSLGIDIIPRKTCTLDCVYCELGPTKKQTMHRKPYVRPANIVEEVRQALSRPERIDTITFSGSGEPTLHTDLGAMIRSIRQLTTIPVAVLTNGTLMYLPEVRNDLMEADIVLPSLDAASLSVFSAINRPHPELRLDGIIEGMRIFRKAYAGEIWLEILLVRGFNDSPAELAKLNAVVRTINPDKIQLNTVVRPPAESAAKPLTRTELEHIRRLFGSRCEVIGHPGERPTEFLAHPDSDRILALLRRRPMTLPELSQGLETPVDTLEHILATLEHEAAIHRFEFDGKEFFQTAEIHHAPLEHKSS